MEIKEIRKARREVILVLESCMAEALQHPGSLDGSSRYNDAQRKLWALDALLSQNRAIHMAKYMVKMTAWKKPTGAPAPRWRR